MKHSTSWGSSPLASAILFACVLVATSAAWAQSDPAQVVDLLISPVDSVVRRGEVVNFRVDARNETTRNFLRDNASGGVALVMTVPRGFVFQAGSGRIVTVGGASIAAADPDTSQAQLVLVADLDAGRRHLNLGRNQGVSFSYQLSVKSPARPGVTATHRVWLQAANGEQLSLKTDARVRVEHDAEFDEAMVFGTVFCDADGDGQRDADERGLGGARVAADTGWYADSDRSGRWHIRKLQPGNHLFKVDTASLPPGSALTTPVKRLTYLSAGLVAQVDFGVRCASEEVSPSRVTRIGQAPSEPSVTLPSEPLEVVTVSGDITSGLVRIDGRALPTLQATLGLVQPMSDASDTPVTGRTLNVPWSPGRLTHPIIFDMGVVTEVDDPALTWKISVFALHEGGRSLVRELAGQGTPPEKLQWSATGPSDRLSVFERGGLYEALLTVADGKTGTASSAPVRIGADYGSSEPVERTTLRGTLFDDTMRPTPRLKRMIKRVLGQMKQREGARLVVEVHSDATDFADMDMTRTRRRAYALREYVGDELGTPRGRFFTMGLGGTRPLMPNIGRRNREFNRRVELVILPPESPGIQRARLPLPPSSARVAVMGITVPIDKDGTYMRAVQRPSGPLGLQIDHPDGGRRAIAVGGAPPGSRRPARPAAEGPDEEPSPQPPPEAGAPVGGTPPAPRVDEDGALVVPGDTGVVFDKKARPSPSLAPPAVEVTPAAPARPEAPPAQPLAEDPLRRFGGQALREALGARSILPAPTELTAPKGITAGDLKVNLPPRGTTLGTTRLFVSGSTHADNRIRINGQAVRVDRQGRFGELIVVPAGKSVVTIESRDEQDHLATIEWPIQVSETEFFLLALVDGVGGQLGARLSELDSYHRRAGESLFIAGRGAVYAKARISGTALAKDLFVTAHLDTTRRREFSEFFDQVVDPGRDYVIFGDGSEDVQDASSRGPLYLLVEADRSKLVVGNFRTGIEGIHLLRYNRTFYGGQLKVEFEAEPGWRTRISGFVSEDNRRLVRRHDELRATGGSIYYLSSRDIVEGSEQIRIQIREQDTGLELGAAPLSRDDHYRIDYQSGRITFATPLSSVMDAHWNIDGFQPFTGRSMLDGHQVVVIVDYESRAVASGGDAAFGVHASQEIAGLVEVGGGYVREGRPAGDGGSEDAHSVFGAHVKLKLAESSTAFFEFAESRAVDGVSQVSTDGGLGFGLLSRAGDQTDGQALKLGLDTAIGELLEVDDLNLRVRGHYQLLEEGFHAGGLVSQQGMEKWGGEIRWKPQRHNEVQLRYDGATVLVTDPDFDTGFRAVKRNRVVGSYRHRVGRWELSSEAGFGEHRDDVDEVVHDVGALALGARVDLSRRLRASMSQEFLVGGDDARLGDGFSDRATTNLGLEYALTDGLSLRLGESLRWNGDNATRLGLRTKLDESTDFYIEDRFAPASSNARAVHSMVMGAETRLDQDGSGRAYGEYRLDSGVGGRTNRAVMGVGKWFQLAPGARLIGAYERIESIGGYEAGRSRDVLSAGLELTLSDRVRFGGVYEARWDRPVDGDEIIHVGVRNGFNIKLADDVTGFAVLNYTMTQNLATRTFEKEDLEATLAAAYRPSEGIAVFGRYSRVLGRSSDSVTDLLGARRDIREKTTTDLITGAAVIELPWRLQLTEKLAWRHTRREVSDMPTAKTDLLLWVNRLALHLVADLDVAVEYRLLAQLRDADAMENGGLIELAYTFFEHARLGVGWSINGVAGWLIPGQDSNDVEDGFYVRLTGTY